MRSTAQLAPAIVLTLGLILGCDSRGTDSDQPAADRGEVVVYTALDKPFSEPILQQFEKETGITVRPVYDTEAQKTVGLYNRIVSEANRPRCDVFWNNEILNTLRLKSAGLLQPCDPNEAANYPPQYRDPDKQWFGFAARARVLIVNTDVVPLEQRPDSIRDLADPAWRGQTGIARPLFGTTASHVACLFAEMGPPDAKALLQSYLDNDVQILAGNKTCAESVARGRLAFGMTDTDDALIELEAGRPVAIVFPDQAADQPGTLLLPNTLALIKDCPNPENGARLINYLLSADVEAQLAASESGQIPLHRDATVQSRAVPDPDFKQMQADFNAAAAAFEEAAKYIEAEFLN